MSPLEVIRQNTETIVSEEEPEKRLAAGRPLKIKLGVDPTRPDLTFGHMVVFNKLRQFQELGHEAILIIGDYTTLIGDPSGRSSTRPVLTREDIAENSRTYLDQAFKILDREKTTVRANSEWFNEMGFEDALILSRKMTVARMLERDDFSKRYGAGSPISIVEFLYPLLQGYDSVVIDADVELGGTDQTFNLLVGRALQRDAGKPEQIVITLPLLVGLDGVKKMSKSMDNFIAFNDDPKNMFGKIMSIGDDLMWDYYRLLLLKSEAEVETLKAGHPMAAKKALAREMTAMLHSSEAADHELAQFEQVFSRNATPDNMPEFTWETLSPEGDTARIANLLGASGLFSSNKEARRMVQQGAVKIDGERWDDPNAELTRPAADLVIQAGKRKFFRITLHDS